MFVLTPIAKEIAPSGSGVDSCSLVYLVPFDFASELVVPELKTFEWWISGLMLNPLFFLITRLNIACSPLIFNLQINYPIRIKDITF